MLINLNSICKEIEQQQCPVHHQYPTTTVENNSIKIKACCNPFQDNLERLLDLKIGEQLDSQIDDVFNSI